MLNVQKLARRPKVFQTLCGLTPERFFLLLRDLEPRWEKAEYARKNWAGRTRGIGGGDKPKLTLPQALFMLLLYYRTYTNHIFVGLVIGIDDSNVGRYFRRLEPVLAGIFAIPEGKITLTNDEVWELIVDATEQETERRPGSGFSGKRKRQTVKTQVHVTPTGIVQAVSSSVPGNVHDKTLYDRSKPTMRDRRGRFRSVRTRGDLGYLGTNCDLPIRKPRGRLLTHREKRFNRAHARQRIPVEHAFAHVKTFRILAHRFRNPLSRYNTIFRNVCGLRNLMTAAV